jgi:hypothetical protein
VKVLLARQNGMEIQPDCQRATGYVEMMYQISDSSISLVNRHNHAEQMASQKLL